ncbi:MAG: dTDP-4-dehydrorhamnose reductase [Bacteroidales bacterium]|nr:dTDP-4-dehydrorhamnose reductase [Bacteroidales bacterium]MBN2748675.1 dTDP-4-dehydrorhamnose reductase [Bacteroidales bacterium]
MAKGKQLVLITGGNGQLGSELARIKDSYSQFEFIVTDYTDLDITNRESVLSYISRVKPDITINCAAYTAVDDAEANPEKAMLLNGDAPGFLSEATSAIGKKLIHISTDYVFGGAGNTPFKENSPTKPNSVYGSTKLIGEANAMRHGNAIVIRTAWLYSSGGNNFVKTIKKLASNTSEIKVVFDQVGTPTWANDLAHGVLAICSAGKFETGIYHYTNEGVCSWYDFALEIVTWYKFSCKVRPVETSDFPRPAKRPAYSVLNKTLVKNTYGLAIPHWKESLYRCLEELE